MSPFQRRRQQAELLVIGALTDGEAPGWTLMRRTGLSGPRLYGALDRLEGTGRIASDWADGPQPRRRVYRLTDRDVTS